LEIFTSKLLEQHIKQTFIIAEKEAKSKNEADLSKILIEHKIDLLFNRQLRVHRENSDFKNCFLRTNEISIPVLLPIWKEIMGMKDNNYLAKMVLMLSIENFFLQITEKTLNEAWLSEYFFEIKKMVDLFNK